jgi:hypothetical protein
MKKTTQIPLASISNYSLLSSKSIILLVNSNCNQNNVIVKDDSLVFLGERTFVIIFLPNQIAVVKSLLQKARDHKHNFTPIMAMLVEIQQLGKRRFKNWLTTMLIGLFLLKNKKRSLFLYTKSLSP